jgi:hypothetical protein
MSACWPTPANATERIDGRGGLEALRDRVWLSLRIILRHVEGVLADVTAVILDATGPAGGVKRTRRRVPAFAAGWLGIVRPTARVTTGPRA